MLYGLLKEHARCALVLFSIIGYFVAIIFLSNLLSPYSYFVKLGEARASGTHTQGDTVYL
jgi:hypothetical protein